ncbi:MAG: adenylate/guanylate cyclase domain-containing protein [Solirubrobacteraceae bacterium]|nr:adenylate/guanylate cyclase domain-containing protein [Solirubrobacteraceae bacterium]
MLPRLFHRLWRRLGPHYPRVALALQALGALFVAVAGMALLTLYQPMTLHEFVVITSVTVVVVLVGNVADLVVVNRLIRPADPWLRGEHTEAAATAAWEALAPLPLDLARSPRTVVILTAVIPVTGFMTWYLGLVWYAWLILLAGSGIVLLYVALLRFYGIEVILRPVLEKLSEELPEAPVDAVRSIPLRWRLLVTLPAINVITAVIVSGLATDGPPRLSDLGVGVFAAVVVSLTFSLELTLLLSHSILDPIEDLRDATKRVGEGDFAARVPVVSGDETGGLAASFNGMVSDLGERARLRDAFGTFVDPGLADRVAEGDDLVAEELDVTVLFLDIRDFTAFASRASAREVVALLNGFYDLVVPILRRHGGHVDKFVGDGLLGVFGAPERIDDHADRAVAAAIEIAAAVERHYGGQLRIGVGVNSGPVVAGTVGGGGRLEFTVIGDPVNTAARVEETTRQTGDDVLVTEATVARMRTQVTMQPRGTVRLRGKTDGVRLFAPEPLAPEVRAGADGSGVRVRPPVTLRRRRT